MAVTPKTPKDSPRSKASATTLSASEALKAAEAAIEGPAEKTPAPKRSVSAAVKPIDANPQKDPTPPPAPTPTPTPTPAPTPGSELEITESLPKEAEPTATQPLPATEGTKIMNDVIENGKKFAEDTKAKFETAYADFNEKTKAHVEKSTKAIEELSDIAKGNVEALVESSKIAAKGMETFGQEAVDYSRKSFEKATASFKSFSTAKTPTEFFQLQSQLLSSSFDEFAKEAAKNSEAMIKLASDVAQPLTARVTLVTDKVKSLAA